MAQPSSFAKKPAGIANEHFLLFRDQHKNDPSISKQKKWYAALAFPFVRVRV